MADQSVVTGYAPPCPVLMNHHGFHNGFPFFLDSDCWWTRLSRTLPDLPLL
jgi:hypothetical protein